MVAQPSIEFGNISKSAIFGQGAMQISSKKRSLSPSPRKSIDSSYVGNPVDSQPIEVSLAELRNVRRNLK
jgi:hypothetical protein